MQTTLVYNPGAGNASKHAPEDIIKALQQAGYDAVYWPTSKEEELDSVLREARDLVVVAGGDGTIRAVATRLLNRNVRIAPLPLGTANNIARTLGLNGKPVEILAGLADPIERDMDLGCITTPYGVDYFLEAMGIGVFADVLEKYDPKDGKSIGRSFTTLLRTLNDYQPKFFHAFVDGVDVSGSYVLFEVMNTPTMGYHYRLATDAKPDDGFFDLVLIHANQREAYLKFIKAVLTGTLEKLPNVSIHRGRKLEIAWRGFPLHIDGEVAGADWMKEHKPPPQQTEPGMLDVSKPYLQVELIPKAVHFLVPKATVGTTP
jgi:diacylglycerol kinase (ATP)